MSSRKIEMKTSPQLLNSFKTISHTSMVLSIVDNDNTMIYIDRYVNTNIHI